jgi:hypothetical protein
MKTTKRYAKLNGSHITETLEQRGQAVEFKKEKVK